MQAKGSSVSKDLRLAETARQPNQTPHLQIIGNTAPAPPTDGNSEMRELWGGAERAAAVLQLQAAILLQRRLSGTSTLLHLADLQRANWPSHKTECKKLKKTPQNNLRTSPSRCPYRPGGVPNKTPGVCPFRDMAEESELQSIIDRDLENGIEGMLELGGCVSRDKVHKLC